MSNTIEQAAHKIINMVYDDLASAKAEMGQNLSASDLAYVVGDRLIDDNEEYQKLDYDTRRNLVEKICKEYV